MSKAAVYVDDGGNVFISENASEIVANAEEAANSPFMNASDNPYPKGSPEHDFWLKKYQEELDYIFSEPGWFFDYDEKVRNIHYYIALAKVNLKTESNRQLSEALNLAPNAVTNWENEKTLPSPETMISLATLADIRGDRAACELMIWKTQGEAQKVYKSLLQKMTGVVALLTVIFCVGFSNTSQASVQANYTPSTMQNYTLSHLYCSFSWLILRHFYQSPFVASTADFRL